MNTIAEDSDMAVKAALDNISKRLDTMATQVDMEQVRDEVSACLRLSWRRWRGLTQSWFSDAQFISEMRERAMFLCVSVRTMQL